ncbi:hypothetical protein MBLNU230_g6415t1 [Neophaeotheca triangularis]
MASLAGTKRPAPDEDHIERPPLKHKVPAYNPSSEENTGAVLDSAEWAAFEQSKSELFNILTQPIRNLKMATEGTDVLLKEAQSRILQHKSQPIIIGMLGSMGTGKSSTLNSLLNVGEIATTGTEGSCTWVTQRFQCSKPGQQEPFMAVVSFFNRKEQRFSRYYKSSRSNDESGGGVSDDDDDDDDADTRKNAVNFFLALFRSRKVCRDKDAVKEFLQTARSEDDNTLLEQCYRWLDALALPEKVTVTAATAGLLVKQLGPYTGRDNEDDDDSDVDSDEELEGSTKVWPLVSSIDVFLDSPLLQQGLVLLDTPGLGDSSRIRRKNAAAFRRTCTHICFVTDASRGKDDRTLTKEVRSSRKVIRDGRIMLVISKSDIIKKGKIPDEHHNQEKQNIRQAKDLATRFGNELNAVDLAIAGEKSGVNRDLELKSLKAQRHRLRVFSKRAEDLGSALRIAVRSRVNEDALQEKLKTATRYAERIPIFSISNEQYEKNLESHLELEAPTLTPEQTNIPALRAHLCRAPNMSRLNEARHQQRTAFPALGKRYEIYAMRSPIERKSAIMSHIKASLAGFPGVIKEGFGHIATALEAKLVKPIRNQEKDWTAKAARLCDKQTSNAKNNTAAFLALMRKDGFRRGNNGVDLSLELLRLNAEAVAGVFDKDSGVSSHISQNLEDMIASLENVVVDMIRKIKDDDCAPLMKLAPYFEYVEIEKSRLQERCNAAQLRLDDGIEEIRRKATNCADESYIGEAMLAVYRQIRQFVGRGTVTSAEGVALDQPKMGWAQYRKVAFKKEVTRTNNIWGAVCNGISNDLQSLFAREQSELTADVELLFKDLHNTFDSMCVTANVVTVEQKRFSAALQESANKAAVYLDTVMRARVDALERRFT